MAGRTLDAPHSRLTLYVRSSNTNSCFIVDGVALQRRRPCARTIMRTPWVESVRLLKPLRSIHAGSRNPFGQVNRPLRRENGRAPAARKKLRRRYWRLDPTAFRRKAVRISWDQARKIILIGAARVIIQGHDLTVRVTSRSGKTYITTEPQIDDAGCPWGCSEAPRGAHHTHGIAARPPAEIFHRAVA
jgi:hypothetical protein